MKPGITTHQKYFLPPPLHGRKIQLASYKYNTHTHIPYVHVMWHWTAPVLLSKKGGGSSRGGEKVQYWGWMQGSHEGSTAHTPRMYSLLVSVISWKTTNSGLSKSKAADECMWTGPTHRELCGRKEGKGSQSHSDDHSLLWTPWDQQIRGVGSFQGVVKSQTYLSVLNTGSPKIT